ncbi:MAG: TRIC cation channel family protein [Candidatus Kapabacteria bacterium]|jgi:uncharacterized membrane protein YeiH|nr:TRIC cation channel family protein [Candidatus Kapabacteria bacterium]
MDPFLQSQFTLPLQWDVFATFLFAAAGTVRTIRRGYDIVGVVIVAVAGSLGGGMLRDVFLGSLPPVALVDVRFMASVLLGAIVGMALHRYVVRAMPVVEFVNTVSIGMYAVFGTQKAILAGLSPLGALFIGVLNAIGGGLLRDIIIREEPEVFRPSHFYAVAIAAGVVTFLVLGRYVSIRAETAAMIAIGVTIAIRSLALRFGWRTRSLM